MMIQIIHASRTYKRLIYFVSLWTCVCFLVFRLAVIPRGKSQFEYITEIREGQRGLLQNNQIDYATGYFAYPAIPTSSNHQVSSSQTNNSSFAKNSSDFAIPSNHLSVDVSSVSEKEILARLANVSNLPLSYWVKIRKKQKAITTTSSGKVCKIEYPSLFELDFNNIYWQRLQTSNGIYYLYSAYYDDRWRGGPLPSVRISAMIDRIKPIPLLCLLWFDDFSGPIITTPTYTYGWYSKWGKKQYIPVFLCILMY